VAPIDNAAMLQAISMMPPDQLYLMAAQLGISPQQAALTNQANAEAAAATEAHVAAHTTAAHAHATSVMGVNSAVAGHAEGVAAMHAANNIREATLQHMCTQQESKICELEAALAASVSERDIVRAENEVHKKELASLFGHAQHIVDSDIKATEAALGIEAFGSIQAQRARGEMIAHLKRDLNLQQELTLEEKTNIELVELRKADHHAALVNAAAPPPPLAPSPLAPPPLAPPPLIEVGQKDTHEPSADLAWSNLFCLFRLRTI